MRSVNNLPLSQRGIKGDFSLSTVNGQRSTILVLDFGAQYARLIARRIRELGVYSEIVPYNISIEELKKRSPQGLILSGGPASVYAPNALKISAGLFNLGIPILGICYGMQLMAQDLEGSVNHTGISEYGKADLKVVADSLLFQKLPKKQQVWMSHQDSVQKPPNGFTITGSTSTSPVAAMEDPSRGLMGVQFHPEVIHSPFGKEVLQNFLFNVCKVKANWTMSSFIEEALENIKQQVGDAKAICAMSGGIDSAVAALLAHKVLGKNLACIFVDHGLLRKDEAKRVDDVFAKHFNLNLKTVQCAERFLSRLKGVLNPEEKRKIIGNEFIKVFEEEAASIKGAEFLVQGTLYPDVIESGGSSESVVIKTHHNVGGLPEDMNLKLIEPLRLLFKDEVRKVATELGMPEDIVYRQPFPGPGLAVRIIGEVTAERLQILREADAIVVEEIKKAGLYREIWQSFAILPAIKSVGVMGDSRTYNHPIVIRAVASEDAMTADWVRLPYEVLEKISSRIINEVKHVNRVAYDISSKPPSTIEWE